MIYELGKTKTFCSFNTYCIKFQITRVVDESMLLTAIIEMLA